jgi:hypothetical protein
MPQTKQIEAVAEQISMMLDEAYATGWNESKLESVDENTLRKEAVRKERKRITTWIYENCKELSDPYPFASKYQYADFVNVSDLIDFITPPDRPLNNERE